MKVFILTLRFLTRIPIPYKSDEMLPNETFAKGILYYSIIGFLVGAINLGVYRIAAYCCGGLIGAVFAVLSGVVVTGAFHLDGLADTCDGLFSSRKKEDMLEIMRDSRIGTNGVIALLFDSILKILIIGTLYSESVKLLILLTPVAGKMATPVFMKSKYAREGKGLGNIYLKDEYTGSMMWSVFIGMFLLTVFLASEGTIIAVAVLLFAWCVKKYIEHKIGGMTGDTLGAGAELAELFFMVLFVVKERFFY